MTRRPSHLALVLSFGTACSSPSSVNPAPTGSQAAGKPGATIAAVIPPNATSVGRFHGLESPIVAVVDPLMPYGYACWTELEQSVHTSYQILLAERKSFFVFDGDLPRDKVEACAGKQLEVNNLAKSGFVREGKLSIIATQGGDLVVGWRDGLTIVGNREQVSGALAQTQSNLAWEKLLAETPVTTATTMISTEQQFGNLLGIPTTSWMITIDAPAVPRPTRQMLGPDDDALTVYAREQERIAKGLPAQEPQPPPARPPGASVHGVFELRYATPADAQRAAAVFSAGDFHFALPLEPSLVTAVKSLPHTVRGSALVVTWDMKDFAGLDLGALMKWFAAAQAQLQPAP
ncbi:MAG TPA: hypothetical protein VGM90_27485 [Kofleriaceae bacterium]|jgi:hypothetical protein